VRWPVSAQQLCQPGGPRRGFERAAQRAFAEQHKALVRQPRAQRRGGAHEQQRVLLGHQTADHGHALRPDRSRARTEALEVDRIRDHRDPRRRRRVLALNVLLHPRRIDDDAGTGTKGTHVHGIEPTALPLAVARRRDQRPAPPETRRPGKRVGDEEPGMHELDAIGGQCTAQAERTADAPAGDHPHRHASPLEQGAVRVGVGAQTVDHRLDGQPVESLAEQAQLPLGSTGRQLADHHPHARRRHQRTDRAVAPIGRHDNLYGTAHCIPIIALPGSPSPLKTESR
jgi:hypothetical protein